MYTVDNHSHRVTMDPSVAVENEPSDESVASETVFESLETDAGECVYDDVGEHLEDDLDEKGIEVYNTQPTSIALVSMGYRFRRN